MQNLNWLLTYFALARSVLVKAVLTMDNDSKPCLISMGLLGFGTFAIAAGLIRRDLGIFILGAVLQVLFLVYLYTQFRREAMKGGE